MSNRESPAGCIGDASLSPSSWPRSSRSWSCRTPRRFGSRTPAAFPRRGSRIALLPPVRGLGGAAPRSTSSGSSTAHCRPGCRSHRTASSAAHPQRQLVVLGRAERPGSALGGLVPPAKSEEEFTINVGPKGSVPDALHRSGSEGRRLGQPVQSAGRRERLRRRRGRGQEGCRRGGRVRHAQRHGVGHECGGLGRGQGRRADREHEQPRPPAGWFEGSTKPCSRSRARSLS